MAAAARQRGACRFRALGKQARHNMLPPQLAPLMGVLAVAAAAKGNLPLLVLGLLISIPLIVFGATLLTKVMERFPIIITVGAALLGFLAGEMLVTDPAATAQFGAASHNTELLAGAIGAALVVALGTYLSKRERGPKSI